MKTELLRRLIPRHLENEYSLAQIFDAYVIVFIHQLGMPPRIFERLVVEDFDDLARAGTETFTYAVGEPLESILRRNPIFVAAMNLPMP